MTQTMRQSFAQSLMIHTALVAAFILVRFVAVDFHPEIRKVKVEIKEIQAPTQVAQPEVKVTEAPPVVTKTPPRRIFGLSKNSLQSDKAGAVEIKAGNTIAKDIDQDKMRPEDADSLPIPAEEYLVNQMPRLKSEVRVPYPAEARASNIEGVVTIDILIDAQGKVRSATLVEGPGHGLNEAAMKVINQFEFVPAQIDGKPVAVRIRYAYRFVLH